MFSYTSYKELITKCTRTRLRRERICIANEDINLRFDKTHIQRTKVPKTDLAESSFIFLILFSILLADVFSVYCSNSEKSSWVNVSPSLSGPMIWKRTLWYSGFYKVAVEFFYVSVREHWNRCKTNVRKLHSKQVSFFNNEQSCTRDELDNYVNIILGHCTRRTTA